MIPGINLLSEAMGIIATQTIGYRKFSGRVLNAQRLWVTSYENDGAFTAMEASVQRIPRHQYVQFNLEFQRNYVNVFASLDMVDLDRDQSGDQFVYNGRLYQLESQGTWFAQDGWAVCMAVDIGPAPPDAMPFIA